MRELVRLKAATLPGWSNNSFDAACHPSNGVTEQVRPRVVCLNMKSFDSCHIIPKAAVSSLFKEGCHRHDAFYREWNDGSFGAVDETMELSPRHAVRGEGPFRGLGVSIFDQFVDELVKAVVLTSGHCY